VRLTGWGQLTGAGVTFEQFVAVQGAALLRLAFVLTGDRHLAEDLAQTALADAYKHWKKVTAAQTRRPTCAGCS
jgi:DNA-directed RNA polymerase specialized sigma24 family protein